MKERKGKYWMCLECAKKKKWKAPEHNVTIIKGLCGHCDREDETTLIPTRDFAKALKWEM